MHEQNQIYTHHKQKRQAGHFVKILVKSDATAKSLKNIAKAVPTLQNRGSKELLTLASILLDCCQKYAELYYSQHILWKLS